MNAQRFFWSVVYSISQITLGIIMHPYQTMRQIVREQVFSWMVLLPVALWVFGLVVWRVVSWLLLTVIPFPNFWTFLALWFSMFCMLYQLLLFYLLIRFIRVRN